MDNVCICIPWVSDNIILCLDLWGVDGVGAFIVGILSVKNVIFHLKIHLYYQLKGLLVGKGAVLTCVLSSTPLSLSGNRKGSKGIINDRG